MKSIKSIESPVVNVKELDKIRVCQETLEDVRFHSSDSKHYFTVRPTLSADLVWANSHLR